MDKEIKKNIKSMIFILVFLIVSTYIVFGARVNLQTLATSIYNPNKSDSLVIKSDDKLNYNNKKYNFVIENKTNSSQEYEIVLTNDYSKSISKNCKILSNNYLSYHINYNDEYNITRNVSLNGIIYKDEIEPLKLKKYDLYLWLDDNNSKVNNKYCYYPKLKINLI